MPDEYIRLDTTVIAIDNLINEAVTGTMARTLIKAKDTIYNQQRYAIDIQPAHGRWELTDNPSFRKCSECGAWWSSDITGNCFTKYCPKCGARMDGDVE